MHHVGYVFEWFGFKSEDQSREARAAAERTACPFVPPACTKAGAACSVHTGHEIVTVCPKRFYYDDFRILREIADSAFAGLDPRLGADGLPTLTPGNVVLEAARRSGESQVGVFGQGWGEGSGEIKLPPASPDGARYSVDFTLCLVSDSGELVAFAPIEVQTMDTTGSYKKSIDGLKQNRRLIEAGFGINWENVNKRILPQLIVKGLMLQGERKCKAGLFFVTPEAVFQRIMRRLGGEKRLRKIPQQPASITFLRFKHDVSSHVPARPVPLEQLPPVTISTSDLSLAFISPENLPAAGSYEQRIAQRL